MNKEIASSKDTDQSSRTCRNCGTAFEGHFCPECGQSAKDMDRPFQEIFWDSLNSSFNLDSRLLRTLIPLLIRPGFLTREFLAGRRIRYISPTRLYFVSSFFFFLCLALIGPEIATDDSDLDGLTEGNDVVIFSPSPDALPPTAETGEEAAPAPEEANTPELENPPEQEDPPADFAGFSQAMDSARKKVGEDPELLMEGFSEKMPIAIFLLLPVFALLLKILYIRRGIHYITHLVFALNLHAFFFLLATLIILIKAVIPNYADLAAFFGVGIYLFIALKYVYRQSVLRTLGKWALLAGSYLIVLGASSVGLMILTLYLIGLG